jgi:type II secretory pathway pseudopilin PulG
MQKKENGFSLVELMIIVAIVSMLGTMIVNQIVVLALRAENAAALSDLRLAAQAQETLKSACGSYGNSENNELPGMGVSGSGVVVMGPSSAENPTILSTSDEQRETHGIAIQLSNSIQLQANNNLYGTTYTMIAKNLDGDTVYGVEAESKTLYMYQSPIFVSLPLPATVSPPPPSELFDFYVPWNPM